MEKHKSIASQLGMSPQHKAIKKRLGDAPIEHKMKKTHHSREYCRHCGEETSRNIRHESGHREFDCVDAPKDTGVKIVG